MLNDWVGMGTVPAAIALFAGAAGAILTTRALPAWLGWLGAVAGLLLLVSLAGVLDRNPEDGIIDIFGFGGFLLFLVWTLAASPALLSTTRRSPADASGARSGRPSRVNRSAARLAGWHRGCGARQLVWRGWRRRGRAVGRIRCSRCSPLPNC